MIQMDRKLSPQSVAHSNSSCDSKQTAILSQDFQSSEYQPTRNKYNTLTPAEAKKLNRFLHNGKQPVRTASVLQRPRPPPIMVTDLDNGRDCLDSASINITSTYTNNYQHHQQQQIRNTSFYASLKDRRHSVNYGRSSTLGRPGVTPNNCNRYFTGQHQLNDSQSNLSYRSSIETSGSYGSSRLQTMSVDLGNPAQVSQIYDGLRARRGSIRSTRTTGTIEYKSNKLSDESFASAKSEISMDFDKTPTKNSQLSSSKISLSSSTYKVLQSPFTNFKRLFRNMPRPFANEPDLKQQQQHISKQQTKNINTNESHHQSLEQSISNLCLNRSQSPPVCPPPPGELKSMPFLTNSINYSNYDEFTKARNDRTKKTDIYDKQLDVYDGPSGNSNNLDNDTSDSTSWQLNSLPVCYERNLTTVVEETRNSIDAKVKLPPIASNQGISTNGLANNLIKPPFRFDDNDNKQQQHAQANGIPNEQTRVISGLGSSSSQSLASTATNDSSLEQHRKAAATAYRFSFAQPVSPLEQPNYQKDIGLPPRMPIGESKQPDTSSGNSSNTSSQLNGINGADRQPFSLLLEQLDKNSDCDYHSGYGNVNGIDEADTTIISETSTIQGDSTSTMYANKVAELERTVTSLKNKLLVKEKELTDLQLEQLHNAYTIDKLKSQNTKLERENNHLKSIMIKTNNNQMILTSRLN